MIPSCFPSVQRHHYALNRSVQLLRLKMRIDFFDLARRMSKQLLDLVERSTILHKPRGERVPQDVEMNSLVCELGLLHIALEEMSHSILIYLLIVQSEDVIGRTLALLALSRTVAVSFNRTVRRLPCFAQDVGPLSI